MPINRGERDLEECPSRSASQMLDGFYHVPRRRSDKGQRSPGHGMEQGKGFGVKHLPEDLNASEFAVRGTSVKLQQAAGSLPQQTPFSGGGW